MKVKWDSALKSSDTEKITIEIEFDPANPMEDGLASMLIGVTETVRQLLVLQQVVQVEDTDYTSE